MKITIFCGASAGHRPIYREKTLQLAQWMIAQGHCLVYGGEKGGLMEVLADTFTAAKAPTIGIIPEHFVEKGWAYPHLSEQIVVNDLSERKEKMMALGEAFIALPGGLGTLEEIVQVISWARIGLHEKPCIFYNVHQYFGHLSSLLDHMVSEGFLSQADRNLFLFTDELSAIADLLHQ